MIVCVCVLALGSSSPGRAGEPVSDEEDGSGGAVAAELGAESIGADYFATFRAKLGVWGEVAGIGCDSENFEPCRTELSAAFQVPIRLRVLDRGTSQPGLVRRADWDEVEDYLRVVQHVEYGEREESFHARLGQLGPLTVGHGSVVNDYFNVVTIDHYELGFEASVDRGGLGGRFLLDNVVDPHVVGGRGWIRPFELLAPDRSEGRLELGTSFFADPAAPTRVEQPASDEVIVGPARQPSVERRRGTALLGFDGSYRVVDADGGELSPYLDYNEHLDLGRGLHTGLRAIGRPGGDVELTGRFEFRLLGEQYLPEYFGPLYEVRRFQTGGWQTSIPVPKLKVAASRSRNRTLGGYGEIGVRAADKVEFSTAYADYEGPRNASLRFRLRVRPIERIRIGAFYYEDGIGHPGQMFDPDRAFVATEGRVGIVGPLYAHGGYSRLWQVRGDGRRQTVDRWRVGVGARVPF